jgi:hypothetical protein
MNGPIDTVTDPPLPDDDSAVYEGRRLILNRIDQEWGCDAVVAYGTRLNITVYCGTPEWEPFSHRCYDHTPGVMHSWDM